jgi:phage tail-like protein
MSNPGALLGAQARTREGFANRAPGFGMTMWFSVVVPSLDAGRPTSLGSWSSCSGLDVTFTPEGPFEEGGNYTRPRHLPGKIGYSKITLERAMTVEGTAKVRKWLQDEAKAWVRGEATVPGTRPAVVITLFSGIGPSAVKIHTWELQEAIPVSWAMPSFSTAGSGGFALEKLVLQHSGFLETGVLPPHSDLVLTDSEGRRLQFLYNPAKIVLTKSRKAATAADKGKHTQVVDADRLSITLSDLRVDGAEEVTYATSVLNTWIELAWKRGAAPRARQPATGPAKPGDKPICGSCQQTLSPSTDKTPGLPRALRVVWGQHGGGMPSTMVLKKFDLTLTRFTADGDPSRASVALTLQDYVDTAPPVRSASLTLGSRSAPPTSAPATGGSHAEDSLRSKGGG